MRKYLAVLLVCLVVAFAGCTTTPTTGPETSSTPAAQTETKPQTETPTEPSQAPAESPTLTYWLPFVGNAALFMESWDDNVVWQNKEKITGVKVEFISPAVGDEATAFNLMINSAELPDMIQFHPYAGYTYPGGGAKAVADGVFLRLNEYIEANAPNYNKIINSSAEFKRQVMTDDGLIWGMGMLEEVRQTSYHGPTVREDWLKELNLKEPATIAEWRDMLAAFKDKKGCSAPFAMNFHGAGTSWSLGWAFDVDIPNGWLQRDGKVIYTFTDPGYLEYLTEMNLWYNEGWISKDFTNDDGPAMIAEGKSGVFETGFWMFTIYENAIREKDPNAVLGPMAYPQKDAGTPVRIRILEPHNRGFETVVTSSCDHPDAAVKWLDWGYSYPEGYLWNNYGEEGVSYTMVNGEPQWTEFMTKNPDGFDLNQLMNKYSLQSGSYVRDWQCIFVAYSPAANETLTLWDGDSSHLLVTRLLSFTQEEGNTNATIMADIGTYVNEMAIKFIKGEEPLSNWDSYVNTVKGMGIDEVVKNYQAAYERYMNRK